MTSRSKLDWVRLFLLFQCAHQTRRIFRMLNQLAAKVVGFQVVVRTERMDNPHLVAGAAGRDIEALLEKFLIAQREGTALRRCPPTR